METIHKFSFEVSDTVSLALPIGARLLTVQEQHGIACAWVRLDPDEERQAVVQFHIRCTGEPLEKFRDQPLGPYVCTFQVGGGALVFHVFRAHGKE